MIIFRRLPGLFYNHVYAVSIVLILSLFFIFLLLSWGFLCSNLAPWNHVTKLCRNYRDGRAVGDMCDALCSSNGAVHSYSCRAFHAGKDAVFAAIWSNTSDDFHIMIKSAEASSDYKADDGLRWTNNPYPTEHEFIDAIHQSVISRLNISLSSEDVVSLSRFASGNAAAEGTDTRRKEIEEIWNLLQDNEYLLCRVYSNYNIFPKIIGTCGQFYFAEYLEPVLDSKLSQFLGNDGSGMSWESRLRFGSLLLDLVDRMNNLDLLICDVKPGHFGLSSNGESIKLLDLDMTFPKVMADKISSDGRSCLKDDECAIFDCASKCDETRICLNKITSTNLQVVCEKVFLGGGKDGLISLGGLLLGDRTPPYLASLLRQCSQGKLARTLQLNSVVKSELKSHKPDGNRESTMYIDY